MSTLETSELPARTRPIPSFNPGGELVHQRWMAFLAVFGSAIVLGLAIGTEKWIYLGLLAAGVVVLYRPVEVAVGLFALIMPFDSIALIGNDSSSGRTITWFVGAGAAVVLIASGLAGRRLKRPPEATFWWIGFSAWATMTIAWAVEPQMVEQRLPTLVALLLLYVAATCMQFSQKEIFWICVLTVLGGCTAALYASYNFYQGHLFHSHDLRATILIGDRQTDPNTFAASLLLPISLAIGGFLSFKRRMWMLASLSATILLGMGILLTGSRGGLLSLGVILLVFFVRSGKGRKMVVPALALLPLLFLVPASFFTRLQEAGESGGAGRWSIWHAGFAALKHYGLIGAGLDNYERVYKDFAGAAPVFWGTGRASHNIYLGMGVEVGLIGLGLMLVAFVIQIRAARKAFVTSVAVARPMLISFEATCIALLVAGCFLDVFWRKWFWFSWILLAAVTRLLVEGSKRYHLVPSP
jgi:O-antigen ligase